MRDQNRATFIPRARLHCPSTPLPPSPNWFLSLSPFVSSPAVPWAGVEMPNMKKKKKKRKDEKKKLSYILSTVPATLQPSQRFLIQIQFSSCFHPQHPTFFFPSFTSLPHPHLSVFFPLFLILFFSHYSLSLSLSASLTPPLPHFTSCFCRLSSISLLTSPLRWRHCLYLSVATWKATCALIARGEGGQRVN